MLTRLRHAHLLICHRAIVCDVLQQRPLYASRWGSGLVVICAEYAALNETYIHGGVANMEETVVIIDERSDL
jgi:hypothetical protein